MRTKEPLPIPPASPISAATKYWATSLFIGIDASHFPNWTGTVHERLFTCRGNELVLRTPPSENSGVTVVNETSWKRDVPGQDS
jgi:hypothetical protein